MKKSRFSDEQIIGILKQHEAGVKTADLCREHGISSPTFYVWKSWYGGMNVNSTLSPILDCQRPMSVQVHLRPQRWHLDSLRLSQFLSSKPR